MMIKPLSCMSAPECHRSALRLLVGLKRVAPQAAPLVAFLSLRRRSRTRLASPLPTSMSSQSTGRPSLSKSGASSHRPGWTSPKPPEKRVSSAMRSSTQRLCKRMQLSHAPLRNHQPSLAIPAGGARASIQPADPAQGEERPDEPASQRRRRRGRGRRGSSVASA